MLETDTSLRATDNSLNSSVNPFDGLSEFNGDDANSENSLLQSISSDSEVSATHRSGLSNVAAQIGGGMMDEVTHHPGNLVSSAAIGIGLGAAAEYGLVVARKTTIGALVGLGGVAAYHLCSELPDWMKNVGVAFRPQGLSATEVEHAEQALRSSGGGLANFIAGGVTAPIGSAVGKFALAETRAQIGGLTSTLALKGNLDVKVLGKTAFKEAPIVDDALTVSNREALPKDRDLQRKPEVQDESITPVRSAASREDLAMMADLEDSVTSKMFNGNYTLGLDADGTVVDVQMLRGEAFIRHEDGIPKEVFYTDDVFRKVVRKDNDTWIAIVDGVEKEPWRGELLLPEFEWMATGPMQLEHGVRPTPFV